MNTKKVWNVKLRGLDENRTYNKNNQHSNNRETYSIYAAGKACSISSANP